MEISSQEGVIPIPINTSYGGGGHMIHNAPAPPQMTTTSNGSIIIPTTLEDHVPYNKKQVKYKECLKNHAASMGGNATDGCGEFMPCGEQGTLEALTCSACNCHRNFHRKEIEGEPISSDYYYQTPPNLNMVGRKFILGHHHHQRNILGAEYHTTAAPPHQMIMSYKIGSHQLASESDDQEDGFVARPTQMVKKRFRTKFTQEQKEKMMNFAEKVGWKIQKQEESVVQQICQEIGVKRRVLKVWMHNNKHNLAKKSSSTDQNQI